MINDQEEEDTILFISKNNFTSKKTKNTNNNLKSTKSSKPNIRKADLKKQTQMHHQQLHKSIKPKLFLGLQISEESHLKQQPPFSQRDDPYNFNEVDKWQGNTFYSNIKRKIHQKLRTQPIDCIKTKFNNLSSKQLNPQNKPKSKLTVSTLQIALDPMCKKLMQQPFQIQRKIYRKVQSNISMVKTNPYKMIRNLSAKIVRDGQLKSKLQQISDNNDIINEKAQISKSQRNIGQINEYAQTCRKNFSKQQIQKKKIKDNNKKNQQKLIGNQQQYAYRKSIKTQHTKSIQVDIGQTFIKQYKKKLKKKQFKQVNQVNENSIIGSDKEGQSIQKKNINFNENLLERKQSAKRTSSKQYKQQQNQRFQPQKVKTQPAALQVLKRMKQTSGSLLYKNQILQSQKKVNPFAKHTITLQQTKLKKKSSSLSSQNRQQNKSPLKIQTFDTNQLLFYFKARNNIKISNRQISIKKIRIKSISGSKGFVGSKGK